MTNNSPVYWTANGFSLHTMSWSVKSFGGKRFVGPGKVGEDLPIPFRRGRSHVPKDRDARVYDINMWVLPLTVAGVRSASLSREQQAHENWRSIVEAVDIRGQFPLVKRWWEGTTIRSAIAQAEYMDGNGPSRDDGTGFDFQLELMLADPYFYEGRPSQSVGAVSIDGDVETDHVVFTFSGGTNPRITLPDGNWIQYNGTVGATPLVVDALNATAKIGSTHVDGMIVRNPKFPEWPRLQPGLGTILLTGGGTATFVYDAAYR